MSRDYVLASPVESMRLERQADLHARDRPLQHIRLAPGGRFLDAGCGSGWVSRKVASAYPQADVVGVDYTPAYVADAQVMAAADGVKNATFEVGDLMSLPFPDASFDVVWSQFVLYFVPDPQQVVRELRRVTKPSGTVISALHKLPCVADPPFEQQRAMDEIIEAAIGRCPPETLPRLFASAGLVDLDVKVELDTIYSKFGGPIDPPHRRNYEEVLLFVPPERRGAVDAWFAFLDRPETTAVSGYWVTSGRVPG